MKELWLLMKEKMVKVHVLVVVKMKHHMIVNKVTLKMNMIKLEVNL